MTDNPEGPQWPVRGSRGLPGTWCLADGPVIRRRHHGTEYPERPFCGRAAGHAGPHESWGDNLVHEWTDAGYAIRDGIPRATATPTQTDE